MTLTINKDTGYAVLHGLASILALANVINDYVVQNAPTLMAVLSNPTDKASLIVAAIAALKSMDHYSDSKDPAQQPPVLPPS